MRTFTAELQGDGPFLIKTKINLLSKGKLAELISNIDLLRSRHMTQNFHRAHALMQIHDACNRRVCFAESHARTDTWVDTQAYTHFVSCTLSRATLYSEHLRAQASGYIVLQ